MTFTHIQIDRELAMAKEKHDADRTARQEPAAKARQHQGSAQSRRNPAQADEQRSDAKPDHAPGRGIGASVGQNAVDRDEHSRPTSQRPSAGTPDLPRERGSSDDVERGGEAQGSLVNDPTGAFKERP